MSKDKQGKDSKKMATADKTKHLSAYKMDSQRKFAEVPAPNLKK